MRRLATTLVLVLALSLANAQTLPRGGRQVKKITITRGGSQPANEGPAEYFTGSVRVD